MMSFLGAWHLLMVPSENQAYSSHPNSKPAVDRAQPPSWCYFLVPKIRTPLGSQERASPHPTAPTNLAEICVPITPAQPCLLPFLRRLNSFLPWNRERCLSTECFLIEQVHMFSDISSLEAAAPQNGRQGVNMGSHFTGKETGALLR